MDNIEDVNTKKALEARKRLDNNDEINRILIKHGFDEDSIDNLFGTIAGVFWVFEEAKQASVNKKENERIAKKTRDLANLIKSNEDLKRLTVEDPDIRKKHLNQKEIYTIKQIQSFMSAHRFLDDFAEYIEGVIIPSSGGHYGLLKSLSGRNLIHSFAARFVHDHLTLLSLRHLGKNKIDKQNVLTASVVTTLLNLNPPMTNLDVTKARKKYGRKKYFIDDRLPINLKWYESLNQS